MSTVSRRLLVWSAALSVVLLSGCQAMSIRTAEADGGPMRVSVQSTPGPAVKTGPPKDALPKGYQRQQLDLGDDCPVTLSLGIPSNWTESSYDSGFVLFSENLGDLSAPSLNINCSQYFGGATSEAWSSKRDYGFTDSGSQVLTERTGKVSQGEYWSYQATYGASAILALEKQPTTAIGSVIAYQTNGRKLTVAIEARAQASDVAAAKTLKTIMPSLTIDGDKVAAPGYK